MSESIPSQLPETLAPEIAEYLKFSTDLLKLVGVDYLLFDDYWTKRNNLERRLEFYRRDLFSSLATDPALELEDLEKFYTSKQPLAPMLSKHDGYVIVDLVKVDDFGQMYPQYGVNLFSYTEADENSIVPSFDGYEVSNALYYAVTTLLERQQQLGWNPTFEPSDSNN